MARVRRNRISAPWLSLSPLAVLLSALVASAPSFAQPCPEFTEGGIAIPQADELSAVVRHLERDRRQGVTLLDSFYLLELSESGDTMRARGRRLVNPSEDRLRRVHELYLAVVTMSSRAADLQKILKRIREQQAGPQGGLQGGLNDEERLLLLSMLGESLVGSSEQVHVLLAHIARELGFTGIEPGERLLFRNPRTGEVHVQSYSGILATGSTDLKEARRLAEAARALGSDSFRPRTASWADYSLSGIWIGNGKSPQARQEYFLNASESTRGASFGNGPTRGFVMHSDLLKSESVSSITAAGSYTLDLSLKPSQLSQAQLSEQQDIARSMNKEIPFLPPAPSSANLPGSWELTPEGKLKLNLPGVNGKPIRLNSGINGKNTVHDIGSSFTVTEPMGNLPISFDINRTFALGPDKSKSMTMDKINVFIDGSDPKRTKPYLSYDGTVYVQQGLENMSHAGLVSKIKAAIPDGKRGDFYTMLRISDVISDKTGMSSDLKKGLGVGAGYRKMLSDFVELDAQVEVNNGASIHDTGSIGADSKASKQVSGSVWIKFKW